MRSVPSPCPVSRVSCPRGIQTSISRCHIELSEHSCKDAGKRGMIIDPTQLGAFRACQYKVFTCRIHLTLTSSTSHRQSAFGAPSRISQSRMRDTMRGALQKFKITLLIQSKYSDEDDILKICDPVCFHSIPCEPFSGRCSCGGL